MANDLRPRLLARMARKYRLASSPLELAGLKIDFTRIADPNRVLDELAEAEDRREKVEGKRREGDELHLPYWAELWDSALALCDELPAIAPSPGTPGEGRGGSILEARNPKSEIRNDPHPASPPEYQGREQKGALRGKTLLDLGCGMGLVGTVAAALGALVTLADLESDALLLARCNAMQFDSDVQAIRLNWRTERLRWRFDFIVGADIIYERAQWEFLEPFWRSHLAAGGTILLGEPGRPGGDAFPAWMAERGWRVEILAHVAPVTGKRIRIMRLES